MAAGRLPPEPGGDASEAARPEPPASGRPGAPEGPDAPLRATLETARARWPGVSVSEERFVRFVAAKLPTGASVVQALGQLCADDLYLACACAGGDARAIAHLEAHCRSTIDRAAARLGASAEQIDEVRQRTRARLLAPRAAADEGRAEPRIAAFSGRGSLRAWVRVTATHETLRLLRPGRHELGEEDDDLARELEREPVAGPELAYFKQLYRDEFKAAFAEAVEALSERDRTVLRQYALDGLSIDSLASLQRVHRARSSGGYACAPTSSRACCASCTASSTSPSRRCSAKPPPASPAGAHARGRARRRGLGVRGASERGGRK
jgi:RNA polymerase sigma-70 factor, ECF subfamily